MRKDQRIAQGGRAKVDVTRTDDCNVEWHARVVCVLPRAEVGYLVLLQAEEDTQRHTSLGACR